MAELGVLNPVAEVKKEKIEIAPRLPDLRGKTIGLYWNMKPGGDVMQEQTCELLKQRHPEIKFKNYTGAVGSLTKYLTEEQADLIAGECEAVVGYTAD